MILIGGRFVDRENPILAYTIFCGVYLFDKQAAVCHIIASRKQVLIFKAPGTRVKNPGPKGQALISPQRSGVCRQIIHAIMEWWKNGIVGVKNG
jgi:hypothetical protein